MAAGVQGDNAKKGIRATLLGVAVNVALAAVKITTGVVGNSYALIADGIESLSDVFTSFVVVVGLAVSMRPPDESHPQGHGKFEVLSAGFVSLMLFAAAGIIVVQSVHEIKLPHSTPAPYTLIVLIGVILVKELLFRSVLRVSEETHSTAVKTDAWHHRSDAITSAAAFIGISIALIGGKGYEAADDWAALFASGIIALNGYKLLAGVFEELTDRNPDPGIERMIRDTAMTVEGVRGTHRCFVRKVGFNFLVELDVEVDGEMSVTDGHVIAHKVRAAIRDASPSVLRVFVHVEPAEQERLDKPEEELYR